MEHFYKKIPGWFSFATLYKKAVADAKEASHFVEVGCWKGRSASFMAVEIANSGKTIQFDCVDTWKGSDEEKHRADPDVRAGRLFKTFLRNTGPVRQRIRPIRKPSVAAAADYPDGSLDLVFIDAAHDYENVKADLATWWPKLKTGGLMAGDDYYFSGVKQAVRESFPEHRSMVGSGNGRQWIVRKDVEEMLTVILWLWTDKRCTSVQYDASRANIAARMIHRNLSLPHRFVLLTDEPGAQYDPLIEPVPLWDDFRDLRSPGVAKDKPQCYVKLRAFSREAAKMLGPRYVSIDLDCVVTGDLDDILRRAEDFIIWQRAPITRAAFQCGAYQSSIWMLRGGARPQVWETFHGLPTLRALEKEKDARNYLLTEQGWILYALGAGEPTWTIRDGLYDWRWLQQEGLENQLPENAKIVFFPGGLKPWTMETRPAWIEKNYHE